MSNESTMTSKRIVTEEMVCDTLTVGSDHASGIATATTEEVNESMLVNKSYFDKHLKDIKRVITLMDPENTLLKDTNVISLSLTDAYFRNDEDWITKSWRIENTKATLSIVGDNHLTINPQRYVAPGHYLLELIVLEIPSGRLELRKNNQWIKTITEPGQYYKEVTIEDVAVDTFSLVAVGLNAKESIVLTKFAFYYITPRFYDYLVDKVKSLASVDAEGFVPREEYQHQLEVFIQQFNVAATMVASQVESHLGERNPHQINPEMIGAAPAAHTHAMYFTGEDIQKVLPGFLTNYSKKDHTHEDYVPRTEVDSVIDQRVREKLAAMVSVSPLVITSGPEGTLPSRFSTVGITAPSTIFHNTMLTHSGNSSYDYTTGMAATNIPELMDEARKVFSLGDEFAHVSSDINPAEKAINFRLTFNHVRRVYGYKIKIRKALLKTWSVISGNTTFLHRIEATTYETDGDVLIYEYKMNDIPLCSSLSFLFENVECELTREGPEGARVGTAIVESGTTASNVEADFWEIKIELDTDSLDNSDTFKITDKEFSFCVPTSGVNRIITHPATNVPMEMAIENPIVEDLPLYIFGGSEMGDNEVRFYTSYFAPEYGNKKSGIDHFVDRFTNITKTVDELGMHDTYSHPAFGTLVLSNGKTEDGFELNNIYSSDVDGWVSIDGVTKVTIEHEFVSDNVTLEGYLMSWRNEEIDTIPDTWTLSYIGKDQYGEEMTVVLDSVDQYYPFYSVEDDDIVYHAQCPTTMSVKKIILTMETTKPNLKISLNKLRLYCCERFYSIAQNTMYLGSTPVSQMCLGRAVYTPQTKWVVNPVTYGKSCTIPLNNLNETTMLDEYEIDNPYLTTDVIVSVQDYALSDTQNSTNSQVYITSVTAEKITLSASGGGIHAVTISRTW